MCVYVYIYNNYVCRYICIYIYIIIMCVCIYIKYIIGMAGSHKVAGYNYVTSWLQCHCTYVHS